MSSQSLTDRTVATTSLVKVPDVLCRGVLFSLTAWNPQGVVLSHTENNRLLERLRIDINLAGMDCCVYESFACAREDDDDQDSKGVDQWYETGLTVHCQKDEGRVLPIIVGLAKQYSQLSIFGQR